MASSSSPSSTRTPPRMELDSRSRSSRLAAFAPGSWMVISTTPSSRASESIRLMRGRGYPQLSGDIALLLILQIIPAGYVSQAGPFFLTYFHDYTSFAEKCYICYL